MQNRASKLLLAHMGLLRLCYLPYHPNPATHIVVPFLPSGTRLAPTQPLVPHELDGLLAGALDIGGPAVDPPPSPAQHHVPSQAPPLEPQHPSQAPHRPLLHPSQSPLAPKQLHTTNGIPPPHASTPLAPQPATLDQPTPKPKLHQAGGVTGGAEQSPNPGTAPPDSQGEAAAHLHPAVTPGTALVQGPSRADVPGSGVKLTGPSPNTAPTPAQRCA